MKRGRTVTWWFVYEFSRGGK